MVQLSTSFVALLAVASALAAPSKRDVATVKDDIAKISDAVNDLNSRITAFPSAASIGSALAIHNSASALGDSIGKATTDTKATDSVSESDGQAILASVEQFQPNILHVLQAIVDNKSALQSLPLPGIGNIVLGDLKSLNTSTGAFSEALINKSPGDLVTKANQIKSDIDSAFATAIAAYS
ncbi:hypothetical protein L218DRAFT_943882 [Marasmius fiardii PR-910]|nr:hypothetical protein L218DRAFT_943882 [Marasmius fiardii PR-910]